MASFDFRTVARVGSGLRLRIGGRFGGRFGGGGAAGASLGGNQVFVFAEDLIDGVDEAEDVVGRLEHGQGVDALDDFGQNIVGHLACREGINLHAVGVFVDTGGIECLVFLVQRFQLGEISGQVQFLCCRLARFVFHVAQQPVDGGGFFAERLVVSFRVGVEHGLEYEGGRLHLFVRAVGEGVHLRVDEDEHPVALLVLIHHLDSFGTLHDAVDAGTFRVDRLPVERGEGFEFELRGGDGGDACVDLCVHVHVGSVGKNSFTDVTDLFC